MELLKAAIDEFHGVVWGYYMDHGRTLPWRTPLLQPDDTGVLHPYAILVSELMLQQTQVGRVVPKYEQFLTQFPTFDALANASLADVLRVWSGLGYNRRAKYLWQTAQTVIGSYGGALPRDSRLLQSLPGIGKNTAAAIQAYAFNEWVVFIETNIRTVYIHHFFADEVEVADRDIVKLVAQTLPMRGRQIECREWYWALMDYGTHLKTTVGNVSRASSQYVRQSPFHGSRRQLRGQILRLLSEGPRSYEQLTFVIKDARLEEVLGQLCAEGMIHNNVSNYSL